MEKAIARIISYAVSVTDPEKVILFGSRARGTHDLHSDVDLLIISAACCPTTELELQISAYAKESCLKADVLIHAPADIESAARSRWSFLTSIMREGKVVYERPVAVDFLVGAAPVAVRQTENPGREKLGADFP